MRINANLVVKSFSRLSLRIILVERPSVGLAHYEAILLAEIGLIECLLSRYAIVFVHRWPFRIDFSLIDCISFECCIIPYCSLAAQRFDKSILRILSGTILVAIVQFLDSLWDLVFHDLLREPLRLLYTLVHRRCHITAILHGSHMILVAIVWDTSMVIFFVII